MRGRATWKAISPVRFRSQIYGALSFISNQPTISFPELTQRMIELRQERETARLASIGTSRIRSLPSDVGQTYSSMTNQMLRVLRATGLITTSGRSISATDLGRRLSQIVRLNGRDADVIFLQRVLNSRFDTYSRFLRRLSEIGGITLPTETLKPENLPDFLSQNGFPLSTWAFFILRDFFYEFALVNFIIREESEQIFPLYSYDGVDDYEAFLESTRGRISYWKKVPLPDFEDALTAAYLARTKSWGRITELVELRELVSQYLKISERQFNAMLEEAVAKSSKLRIYTSIGALSVGRKTGYLIKTLSLPTSKRGYPLTLIRISKGGEDS